jgi:hypothetical protein
MRNAMHFTVWLFMAMQASVAFSQTEKTDSITLKDSTQTVKIEKKGQHSTKNNQSNAERSGDIWQATLDKIQPKRQLD